MLELLKPWAAKIGAPDLIMRERPSVAVDPSATTAGGRAGNLLAEYAAVTKAIGFQHPHIDADLRIESFKDFLRSKDWAIFSLPAVTEYMDKKAAEESAAKAGWLWRPLREMDNLTNAKFGRAAHRWGHEEGQAQSASDYYNGPHQERQQVWSNARQTHESAMRDIAPSAAPYDRLVPLHALRKVQAVEDQYAGEEYVSFFISDYAPAPHIEYPDPFLMAVVDNARLDRGVGRFVIDFWDEPGFGLDKQLGLSGA